MVAVEAIGTPGRQRIQALAQLAHAGLVYLEAPALAVQRADHGSLSLDLGGRRDLEAGGGHPARHQVERVPEHVAVGAVERVGAAARSRQENPVFPGRLAGLQKVGDELAGLVGTQSGFGARPPAQVDRLEVNLLR